MLVALGFFVAAFAAVSLWLSQRGKLTLKTWGASAFLVAWVVGVGLKVHFDRSSTAGGEDVSSSSAAALPSIAWPEARSSGTAAAGAGDSAGASGTRVAPVDSLVGGLQERLAKEPNDAKGWALLAQSYSFMGDAAGAEDAVKKAVALGFDEQGLRERVIGAARGPH